MNPAQSMEYEKIDQLRRQHIKMAENRCRKFRRGNVPYSTTIQEARNKIEAWSLLLRHKKGLHISSRKLERTMKKAVIPLSRKSDLQLIIKDELSIAYKKYYTLKKDAAQLRETHLENLASAIATQGNLKKSNILKQLRTREAQRSTARKIKYLRGKLIRNSTTMVSIKQNNGTSVDITDKRQMEKAIISSNKKKFQQSFGTPFYKHPYNQLFGYQGLTTASQQVLNGNFTPPINASTYMKDFLSHLATPQVIKNNPNNMSLTTKTFVNFWRKAKENTSCFPSEITFATLKASSYDDTLANLDCALTRIPLETGYSPKRWQRCVDVMTKKKSNRSDIENLRTICLFEADANYAFKHIGRQMMLNAELHSTLAKEQYGSRKRHRAIDLALNKVLTNDVLRQAKQTGAVCSNDAKACYDLIGHAQASLCMQRQGVPKSAVQCLFTTLQEATHYVRTAFGDSSISRTRLDKTITWHRTG
jgi:hypothetical protein